MYQNKPRSKEEVAEMVRELESYNWAGYYLDCEVQTCPKCQAVVLKGRVCWRCGNE